MKKLLLLVLFSLGLYAQPSNPQVQFRTTDPAGACAPQPLWFNYTLGKIWGCKAGTWTLMADGSTGSGTVTSVSGTANEISVANGTTTPVVSVAAAFDISGHTSTAPIKKGTSLPATCAIGEFYDKTDATAGSNLFSCTAVNTWTAIGGGTSNQNVRSFGAAFDGGGTALTTAKVAYITVPFSCTITGYNITADAGTIDFDVWKIATGTAIPTVANTIISMSSYLALSTGTAVHSTSTAALTTTAVTAFDIIGIKIHAVATATLASLVIPCTAN